MTSNARRSLWGWFACLLLMSFACRAASPAGPRSASVALQSAELGSGVPETPRESTADSLHGVRVPDPYRWLEEGDQPRVRGWVEKQVALGRAYLDRQPEREAVASRLRQLFYFDWTTPPAHEGKRWFFQRRHKDKEKPVFYYRDTLDGEERVAIDANRLSEDGSVSLQGAWPSPSGRYVAYKQSRNNTDAGTLHVRDLDTGEERESERIAGANYHTGVAWQRDEGFYYTWQPTDANVPVTERPKKVELRFHQLGAAPESDATIVAANPDPTIALLAEASSDGRWLIVRWKGTRSHGVWIKDLRQPPTDTPSHPWNDPFERAGLTQLVVGKDADYWVQAWKDRFYVRTNEGAARGRILRVDPRRPQRGSWEEIVPEHPTAILEGLRVAGGRLALHWQSDVQSRLEVRSLEGRVLHEVALPGIGSISGIYGQPDEDEAYYAFASFTAPPRVFSMSMKTGRSRLWGQPDLPVDLSMFETRQVFFESKDGTRVPMFLVHRRELPRDGEQPTLLTGYGGFGIGQKPSFSPYDAVWLERGGVIAVPNLRGGNEYGRSWHLGGARENKQNVFDDFTAAARWLISERLTRPERLAISGASNGGLLVGAAMTQHPELFKAVVCSVPVLDMLRYHHFANGVNPEYGSADDPEQFRFLHAYSPYHRVQRGTRYPALLMMSADSDDRVTPMHARKFLAAIQWAQSGDAPALLRVEANAGHDGGDAVARRIAWGVDSLVFLFDQLGMTDT